jgi:hypothetical protein
VETLNVPYLTSGKGSTPAQGGCIMQVVDWVARNGWTDNPPCVHPLLRGVAIAVNDSVMDEQRQRLLDMIPRLINTHLPGGGQDAALVRALDQRWSAEMGELVMDFPHSTLQNWPERSERLLMAFEGLLDLYDEIVGRPKSTGQVDLSALCALQNV